MALAWQEGTRTAVALETRDSRDGTGGGGAPFS